MEALSAEFPDVDFFHATGYLSNDSNFGNYFGRIYQARYLTGLTAGAATETNEIGYVAAFPIPEVIRGINAFTLGVREVNPDATVTVNWTSTWFDPAVEGEAAQALLDGGADVIAMHQDSTAAGERAEAACARWISYNSDMSEFAPNAYLSSAIWNWGHYYALAIESVADGSFAGGGTWPGMETGMVQIGSLADDVSQDIRDLIDQRSQEMISGSFDLFTGPINDQDGNEIIAAGVTLPDFADEWPVPSRHERLRRRGRFGRRVIHPAVELDGIWNGFPALLPMPGRASRFAPAPCTLCLQRTAPGRPR